MSDITTRHIRTGWAEWIDWPEDVVKTSSTMCGRRTRAGLTGIPGITSQSQIVEKRGKRVWGWCSACVNVVWPYLLPETLDVSYTSPAIVELHEQMRDEIAAQHMQIRRN